MDFIMKLSRRRSFYAATAPAVLSAVSRFAWAESYPTRPVRIIVTFPPGGSNDIHARLLGQWLSSRLGKPFIVENRSGGGGNIGTEAVVRSVPDGYTLLLLSVGIAINAAFYPNLSYDLVRDIAPIAAFFRSAYVMLVNPSLPTKTVPEFITYAKANPGKINFGSNGVGATGHLAGEMFKMLTGVNMMHVPYRGEAPALVDLVGGQVQVMFATMTSSIPMVRDGQVRALAVTSVDRSRALPDIAPLAEFVAGYEVSTWSGMGAPAKTPAEIIDKLNQEMNAGLASPAIKAKYADLGLETFATSPGEFGKLIAADVEKWKRVVKFAGIRPT
jgi:tripartite-type tricarboxylate transporter receptor subunit TctC